MTGAKAQVPYGPEREIVLEADWRVEVVADVRHEKVDVEKYGGGKHPGCLANEKYADEGQGSV